jgi:hypothetical protein
MLMIQDSFRVQIPLLEEYVYVFGLKCPHLLWSGRFIPYNEFAPRSTIVINTAHPFSMMTLVHECGHYLDFILRVMDGDDSGQSKVQAEYTAMMIELVVRRTNGIDWLKSLMPKLYLEVANELEHRDTEEMIAEFSGRWHRTFEKGSS